jgi:glutaredoxin-related protein
MISDDHIATSLINNILEDADVDIVITLLIIRKDDPSVPLCGFTNVNYHAITADGNHVIGEVQVINHYNFDKFALFYIAYAFANQAFLKETGIGGGIR